MHAHMHIHIHMHIHACMPVHTHTHACTHIIFCELAGFQALGDQSKDRVSEMRLALFCGLHLS